MDSDNNYNLLDCINLAPMKYARWDRPFLSAWVEFVQQKAPEILRLGEFEAFRRWILSDPECFSVPVEPETSHKVARDFFKKLRNEQKSAN
jgi:hypothetical protein